ncbi:hypothetical protein ER308_18710 [Egibacter rhizosphaerae]|uniref:Tyr recombinase domain-containing protein n=1 Tax=Egibacter rhizosphaerae TaxID=1670831 RepID=A0A411YJN7_9ACTN|nr:hypothetical protein ER308_18710 [Egibacter rhizosphaerae]
MTGHGGRRRSAGITPSRETGMHQLRYHYASVLLDAGVSIRALADYLGHTDRGSPCGCTPT